MVIFSIKWWMFFLKSAYYKALHNHFLFNFNKRPTYLLTAFYVAVSCVEWVQPLGNKDVFYSIQLKKTLLHICCAAESKKKSQFLVSPASEIKHHLCVQRTGRLFIIFCLTVLTCAGDEPLIHLLLMRTSAVTGHIWLFVQDLKLVWVWPSISTVFPVVQIDIKCLSLYSKYSHFQECESKSQNRTK